MPNYDQLLELTFLFRIIVRKSREHWRQSVSSDLTMTQYRMLRVLHEEGPQRASALAARLSVTSGAITGIADHLIAKNYVTRARSEQDRRVVILRITEEGDRMISFWKQKQNETVFSMFAHLPQEDIEQLNRIFKKILEHEKESFGSGASDTST